jgi:medium-chain acyl-[acyl-carrier-protein] hydrolase
MRLFCFPYAGAGAAVYRLWSDVLPAEIELCRIQLPGRENRRREPLFTQLSPLVQTLAQVLRPFLNLPFAFFGHSLGALISVELARELRKRHDLSPAYLFASGFRAPHIPNPDPPMYQLPDAAFVEEMLRRYDGIPEAVRRHAELMELLLPTLRADTAICETYVYTDDDPLDCPIAAFGGLQDRQVSHDDLAAWHDQTRSSFTLRMFPGNHFFVQSACGPLLQVVSQELTWSMSQIP